MTGKSVLTTLLISAAITAFIVMFAAPAAVTSFAYSGIHIASSLITANLQSHGNVMLAGATVRDHRSCAPNCGTFYTGGGGYGGRGGGGRRGITPPPVSPGGGQGGVTVTPTPGSQRGIPCLGNLC